MRPITAAILSILRQREGLSLKAYPDPASPRARFLREHKRDDPNLSGKPWTIGFGHTGPEVKEGMVWTLNDAERALLTDAERHAKGIDLHIKVPLTDDQWTACVCLAFNIGITAFNESHLLIELNKGNILLAANRFLDFKYAGGHLDELLMKRRRIERDLFLRGVGAPDVA